MTQVDRTRNRTRGAFLPFVRALIRRAREPLMNKMSRWTRHESAKTFLPLESAIAEPTPEPADALGARRNLSVSATDTDVRLNPAEE